MLAIILKLSSFNRLITILQVLIIKSPPSSSGGLDNLSQESPVQANIIAAHQQYRL